MNIRRKALLIILDGWGNGNGTKSDAIAQANTPFMDSLKSQQNSVLLTSGEDVGLPEGQMGNSEVGHLNIGAGRIVYQDFVRINKAIKSGEMSQNETLLEAYKYAKENNKSVHFIGLLGDGGVHSHSSHLIELIEIANDQGLEKLYIHALTDGRDTDPKSGLGFMKDLLEHIDHTSAKVASLCGRYYTMDRDNRWDRVKKGYDLMTKGIGEKFHNVIAAIKASYVNQITDEFIEPVVLVDDQENPIATISDGDVVICFNFRTDRLRQITKALTQKDFPEQDMKTLPLNYITMTTYDESFRNVEVLFDKQDLNQTLGEVISQNGLKQLRIAETEKYAHVTFFFNGGQETPFEGESRILIPSPKVATYDLQPEMSAPLVKDALVAELNKKEHDFICLNFANTDMVGHTGIYKAILKAVETVDQCVKEVVETAVKNDYSVIITADHGNSDFAINEDGSPNTAHSLNPVPVYILDPEFKNLNSGRLCDLAPTIIKLMGMKQPSEMNGVPLF